ncbi:kunitz trypsin inhibitor 5-like [Impatiens glandulifera]|uniref:kunitz trypsin inhibitor 5-like n=1 Tax=Impatiens glandulifera TaxID=253017 RepID=UPI001FB1810E|nr:kunitz trypsin inhibitor 5-like [Impatiens glandulifera]
MKSAEISFSLLLIFSLLFSFATPTPVKDIDGKQLQSGVKYNILPVIRGQGGGLRLAFTGRINTTVSNCPLDVVQSKSEIDNGLPVTFSPTNGSNSKSVIRESTDLNFKFVASTTCVQSTVWKLAGFDDLTRRYFVTTGGVEGNPGRLTVSNWFKIEKIGVDVISYKLVLCPMVCNFCKVICKDVGSYHDGKGYLRRLVLTDDAPLYVMFKKV